MNEQKFSVIDDHTPKPVDLVRRAKTIATKLGKQGRYQVWMHLSQVKGSRLHVLFRREDLVTEDEFLVWYFKKRNDLIRFSRFLRDMRTVQYWSVGPKN